MPLSQQGELGVGITADGTAVLFNVSMPLSQQGELGALNLSKREKKKRRLNAALAAR